MFGRLRPFQIGLIVVVGTFLGAVSLSAASFQLTSKDVEDAIRTGKQSLIQEEFGREWQQANPKGDEVTVQTPFYRLALSARLSAFRGEELQKADIDKLVQATQGRLMFWVVIRGAKPDFAKTFQPVLVMEGKELKPVFVQNERTALLLEDGRYLARCVYAFPTEELRSNASLALVVRTFEGQEVSRFQVNLATMR